MGYSRLGLVLGVIVLVAGAALVAFGSQGTAYLARAIEGARTPTDLIPGIAIALAGLVILVLSRDGGGRRGLRLDWPAVPGVDAAYQEHGRWARHYSTVRMAVATLLFSVSGAFAAVSLEAPAGSRPRDVLLIVGAAFLALSWSIFVLFTRLSYRRGNAQVRMLRREAGDGEPAAGPRERLWLADPALIVLTVALIAVLVFGPCLRDVPAIHGG